MNIWYFVFEKSSDVPTCFFFRNNLRFLSHHVILENLKLQRPHSKWSNTHEKVFSGDFSLSLQWWDFCHFLWLWEDSEITLRRLWDNSEMTLRWLWDDSETTLRRIWDDSETTLRQHWDNSETSLRQLWCNDIRNLQSCIFNLPLPSKYHYPFECQSLGLTKCSSFLV